MEKKLAEIRKKVVALVDKRNDLVLTGKAKVKAIANIDEKIQKAVKEYASLKETCVFNECKASDDPMLEAIKRLNYTVICVKDEKKDADDQAVLQKVDEKFKDIDLAKLHKKCGSIGKDKNWIYILEHFNCLLTMRAAQDLGLDPKEVNDSYAMNKLSREINLGKNPVSNTNIVKTLQKVVNAMIGEEFKATSHDQKFIDMVYTRKSREALKVTCGNHRQLRGILAQVCHKLVLGKSYSVDYKKVQA